jgi:hypothetical protein
MKIDKTKEYSFVEAWQKGMISDDSFITSKTSGDSYKIEKHQKGNLLKFYSATLDTWQKCMYVLPEEIFNTWYVTSKIKDEVIL